MFTTAHRATGSRDRHHRSAVTIAVLAVALAAATALLLLLPGPTATPGHSSTGHSSAGHSSAAERASGDGASRPSPVPPLQRINEGCSIAHFGVPC